MTALLENKHLLIVGYCCILFFRLKTVNLVLKNTQAAEALVKLYETKLCEEEAVIADKNNIENLISTLKVCTFWYIRLFAKMVL